MSSISYNDFSFDSTWSGSAHDSLTSKLKIAIDNFNKQIDNYDKVMEAASMLDDYKSKKSQYESLNNQLSGLDYSKDADEINSIKSEMSSLSSQMTSLKNSINSIANSINSVSSIYNVINYTVQDTYSKYLDNLCDLSSFYTQGDMTKLSDGTSIYDYYNKEEVDNYLEYIRQTSKPGEADVNCAKAMMRLASKVNKEINVDLDVVTSEVIVTQGNVTEVKRVSFSDSLKSVISTNPYAYWQQNEDKLSDSDKIRFRVISRMAGQYSSEEDNEERKRYTV